jgi:hypothetical protein
MDFKDLNLDWPVELVEQGTLLLTRLTNSAAELDIFPTSYSVPTPIERMSMNLISLRSERILGGLLGLKV